MHHSREPALLFNSLIGFGAFSLERTARIARRLLRTFLDDDSQDFENGLQASFGRNLDLVLQEVSRNFVRYCSSCWIRLCMKKWYEIWKGESGKHGEVRFDWGKKETEYIGLRRL